MGAAAGRIDEVDPDELSHELRTPLTVLRCWLAAAAERQSFVASHDMEALAACLSSVERLERAVEAAERAFRQAGDTPCRHSRLAGGGRWWAKRFAAPGRRPRTPSPPPR